MSRYRLPHLRLAAIAGHGLSFVAADESEARRDASHWYVRLREEEEDEAVRAKFAAWLGADPLHAKAWASMCETMEAIGRAPPEHRSYPMPAPPRRQRGRGRIVGALVRGRPRKRIAVTSVAAASAFLLALPTVSLHLRADNITGAGQVEQIRLADGSTVQLGPDSAVAIDYDGQDRKVRLLTGQALFDVTLNPTRPFRVVAGDVTTTVLGTSFDVRMIGGATSVAVRRGHVRVDDDGAAPPSSHDLHAGNWVRIDARHAAQTGVVTPELVGGWSNGEVLAEKRSIASVIEEIRPWYGGKIMVTDAELASRRVTGIYNLKDPAQALSMIVKPYGGRVRRITPWLLIVSGS